MVMDYKKLNKKKKKERNHEPRVILLNKRTKIFFTAEGCLKM